MARIAEANEGARTIEIGAHPRIYYFTGKHDIFVAETVLGTVSATHCTSSTFPGPGGIHLQDTIHLNIAFDTKRTVEGAITGVIDTLRFLEIIAGRPQNVVELKFSLDAPSRERATTLDAYWCLRPQRHGDDESRKPHSADLPLQAGIHPEAFAGVLTRWLERNGGWRVARARYATAAAYQSRYGTDRLIGAANMFDIMPAAACPTVVPLSPDLAKARDGARAAFRALSPSPERDSVLNALGRIGKPTLKRKIRSRVQLITDRVGTQFPELELVTDQAVDCRNFFVHGTQGKFDYDAHFDQFCFFTNTLEFVFAAADLIDAGWDIAEWVKEGTTMSHPFARYRVSYAERLAELKELLT